MHPVLTTLELGPRPLPIGSYGALLALALAVGTLLALRAAVRARMDAGAVIAALGSAIGGGFLGGWLLHLLVQTLRLGDPALALQRPGLAFFGAALGGLAALAFAGRRLRLDVPQLLDRAVPAIALAHAIGRVGCLLGGCCHGAPAPDGAPALLYTDPLAPASALGVPLHPVPLYEAAGLLLLALAFGRGAPDLRHPGRRFVAYVALYSALRFGLEALRGDGVRGVWPWLSLSTSQLIALVLIALAAFGTQGAMRRYLLPTTLLALLALAAVPLPAARVAAEGRVELRLQAPARVRIEAGWFTMGSDEADVAYAVQLCQRTGVGEAGCRPERFEHERPRHRVHTRAYRIDRTEVTNAAYGRCVAASVCEPARLSGDDARLGLPRHPVAGVTHAQAARYCQWVGGQLPTEAQWERAARGSSLRRFPWGQHYNSRVANHGDDAPDAALLDGYRFAAPVGALLAGRSAHGLFDMAGNVWELTADFYDASGYGERGAVEPTGPASGEAHVVRGGSWRSPAHALRSTHRAQLPRGESQPDVGFRCAYNVSSPVVSPGAEPAGPKKSG